MCKSIFTVFVIIFFPLICFCRDKNIICGKFPAIADYSFSISDPIDGYYNSALISTASPKDFIAGKDSFYYKTVSPLEPSFYDIYIKKDGQFVGRTTFLMVPGDSIHLDFDLSRTDYSWLTFSGSNEAGNNLFNKINYSPIQKFIPIMNLIKTLSTDSLVFIGRFDSIVVNATAGFEKEYQNKNISKAFYESMLLTFKTLFIWQAARQIYGSPSQLSESVGTATRTEIVRRLFNKISPDDKRIPGLYRSIHFYVAYYDFQTAQKKGLSYWEHLEGVEEKITVGDSVVVLDKILVHLPAIQPRKRQEILWLLYLHDIFRLTKGYFTTAVIDQYRFIFPESKYVKYLQDGYTENNSEEAEYVLQQPVEIIDSSRRYKSVSDIARNVFKDKAVFVDLWASWCGPCISEFSYNYPLDSFLLKNNIEKLYISFDAIGNTAGWLKAIDKFKLGGKHVLINNQLEKDIKIMLHSDSDRGVEIPRYMLIDAKGRLINNNLFRPSQKSYLINQIQQILHL